MSDESEAASKGVLVSKETSVIRRGVDVPMLEQSERAGRQFGKEAFLCGLLHDVGKLALIRALPKRYAAVVVTGEDAEDLPFR